LESAQVAGYVTAEAAEVSGLKPGTRVVAGAADQATGALGSGMVAPGVVAATLGTGGQLVTLATAPRVDRELRIHTFCHALPAQWYLLGATLSAGLSFRWLRDAVLEETGPDAYPRMAALAEQAPPGAEGLLFMPYLIGERTVGDYVGAGLARPGSRQRAGVPAQGGHPGPPGRPSGGAFVGLTLRHGRAHMVRAVMEGVLFSLKRYLDVFEGLGVGYTRILATGGGARSPLWRQMMADVFGAPVAPLAVQEQSALGAAILAGLGAGVYAGPAEACARLVSYGDPLEPRPEAVDLYRERYAAFIAWYEKMRG
jgi:xylulokinase